MFLLKKLFSLLLAASLCFTLASCGETEATPASSEEEKTSVTLTVNEETATGEKSASLAVDTALKAGTVVTAAVTGTKYLTLEYFGLPKTIVYVPNGTYVFTVPQKGHQKDYPDGTFTSPCTLTASVPNKEEITASRLISVNPYDLKDNTAYPHATTNNEYNNGNDPDFWVRNAIDGFTDNDSHGSYPHQSWGPERVDTVECAVDFGRAVAVSEITIFVRADFPHDIEWASCDVCDENGTVLKTLEFTHTKDGQVFTFDAPVTVTKLTFKNMQSKEANKSEGSRKWVGFTEISVTGYDTLL